MGTFFLIPFTNALNLLNAYVEMLFKLKEGAIFPPYNMLTFNVHIFILFLNLLLALVVLFCVGSPGIAIRVGSFFFTPTKHQGTGAGTVVSGF